jgi:hypothetical protein
VTNQQKKKDEYQKLHEAAKKIVEESEDIQADVHKLTMEALSKGNLDKERIKSVVQSVLEGAEVGAKDKGEHLKAALSDAVKGLDEALVQTAGATKLAIQEAAGQIKDYTQTDLKQALNDLEDMEANFIDVIKEVANSSTDLASRILHDIATHAKNSGTAVGKKSAESMATLRDQLKQLSKDSFEAGAEAAKSVSIKIARASSGFLAGLADTIEGGHGKEKSESPVTSSTATTSTTTTTPADSAAAGTSGANKKGDKTT